MTPEQKHHHLLREHAKTRRANQLLIGFLLFLSFLVGISGSDFMLNIATLGAIWLVGFCLIYVDRHIHALLEYRQISRNFYRELDAVEENLTVPIGDAGLNAQDQAEFDDLVRRYHGPAQ